ncbi:MAG TPA: flagellar hook-basal body complex protein [Pirellulales bacterium]|nr:flagellar hook-basal body complex protein [Pirellulales bacterium]
MSAGRTVSMLVIGCLLVGCSDQRTSPRRRTQARGAQATAQTNKPATDVAKGQVVPAAHIEPVSTPATATPTLLEETPDTDTDGIAAGHDEADRLLREAVKALRAKLTVISHNLAHADTVAFKRSRLLFEDCGYRQVKLPGGQDAFNNYAPINLALGLGIRVQGTQMMFDQGNFEVTNQPLDLAIDGEGFFQVKEPTTDNFLYTRAGNLAVNSNGVLVVGSSNTGRVVQPQISMPIDTTAVVVSAEGNVSIQQYGQTQFSQIGQFQLAKFLNPQGLLAVGENLYQETLASGEGVFGHPGTNGLGTIQQNTLERSNVDLDEELLAWKETERALKAFERLLKAPSR